MKAFSRMAAMSVCLVFAGCAGAGQAVDLWGRDVKHVTRQVGKVGPDGLREVTGIGRAIVTLLDDVAQLLSVPFNA